MALLPPVRNGGGGEWATAGSSRKLMPYLPPWWLVAASSIFARSRAQPSIVSIRLSRTSAFDLAPEVPLVYLRGASGDLVDAIGLRSPAVSCGPFTRQHVRFDRSMAATHKLEEMQYNATTVTAALLFLRGAHKTRVQSREKAVRKRVTQGFELMFTTLNSHTEVSGVQHCVNSVSCRRSRSCVLPSALRPYFASQRSSS
jgi:hypothetical protein